MERRPFYTGCTPLSGSVLSGATCGFLAIRFSGRDLMAGGILWLLGGYVLGALGGYLIVVALSHLFGEWWNE